MNKPEILDELRMEIGLSFDYAESLDDFFSRIVYNFDSLPEDFCCAIYENHWNEFVKNCSGKAWHMPASVPFGHKPLSLCAIRGSITVYYEIDKHYLLSPFYKGCQLLGIFIVGVPHGKYRIEEEDLLFMEEVSRFYHPGYLVFKDETLPERYKNRAGLLCFILFMKKINKRWYIK